MYFISTLTDKFACILSGKKSSPKKIKFYLASFIIIGLFFLLK